MIFLLIFSSSKKLSLVVAAYLVRKIPITIDQNSIIHRVTWQNHILANHRVSDPVSNGEDPDTGSISEKKTLSASDLPTAKYQFSITYLSRDETITTILSAQSHSPLFN